MDYRSSSKASQDTATVRAASVELGSEVVDRKRKRIFSTQDREDLFDQFAAEFVEPEEDPRQSIRQQGGRRIEGLGDLDKDELRHCFEILRIAYKWTFGSYSQLDGVDMERILSKRILSHINHLPQKTQHSQISCTSLYWGGISHSAISHTSIGSGTTASEQIFVKCEIQSHRLGLSTYPVHGKSLDRVYVPHTKHVTWESQALCAEATREACQELLDFVAKDIERYNFQRAKQYILRYISALIFSTETPDELADLSFVDITDVRAIYSTSALLTPEVDPKHSAYWYRRVRDGQEV